MFERFTDRARRVVVLAQEEARLLNHNYIGTEHMLLAILHEGEGIAAQALIACEVRLDTARAETVRIVGRGTSAPTGHIPFTVRAKTALERSLREALQLGHNYIGSEHVLLGLLHERKGDARKILHNLHAEPGDVRAKVLELLGEHPEPEAPAPGERMVLVVSGRTAEHLDEVVREVHELTGRAPDVLQRRTPESGVDEAIADRLRRKGTRADAVIVLLHADEASTDARPWASQDVIYELGWFHGLLGRRRVVVLAEEGVAPPTGVTGIALDAAGTWRAALDASLQAAGIDTESDAPGEPA